jgi:hypothetical protein
MHQGFVRLPTVGTRVVAGPSHKELHAGSSMMITTMRYDISDHEFLLVLLINLIRTEEKGSQIMNMRLDLPLVPEVEISSFTLIKYIKLKEVNNCWSF